MKKSYFIIFLLVITGCKLKQFQHAEVFPTDSTNVEPIEQTEPNYPVRESYRAEHTHIFDLIHTKLDVRFDFKKSQLNGKATLTLKPWFYPQNILTLDAKGMDIHKVQLVRDTGNLDLTYNYNLSHLEINLNKKYTRTDTITIFIDYTAKPEELETKGSAAITSDKGLYFINPDSSEVGKPTQVWTQGETESNSVWFPTLDTPNEKMTQEIYMTVPDKFITLSNGLLMFQTPNDDGTRTDAWKMDKPHAPYLAMMAVGDFYVYHDKWTRKDGSNIDVDYYVEPDYKDDAKAIFGNTPEMLTFYSTILGVEYPWDKFSQIVVRDYVSGAMENTTAVVHGEFVQQHKREMIDNNYEDVIAHELFHHWFGDYTTCESWSNIPLNESFADYSEYLWAEYKYGRDEADLIWENALNSYLYEANGYNGRGGKKVDMIRFQYEDKDDMFDSHSYAKGGRILHMLRKYVGDDAFFASLNDFLTTNAYSPVEIHQLRLSFEKVTGEDLNWFFNEWFLDKGHPELDISHNYNDTTKVLTLRVEQQQDFSISPVYRIPVYVDIYANGKKERHEIVIDSVVQEYNFLISSVPDLVNFDGEKAILCTRTEHKSYAEWKFQFYNAPLYLDRSMALKQVALKKSITSAQVVLDALDDPFYEIKSIAMGLIVDGGVLTYFSKELKEKLIQLANSDVKSTIRSSAINKLSEYFSNDLTLSELYSKKLKDSSYAVMGSALTSLATLDPSKAVVLVKEYENEKDQSIRNTVTKIHSQYGNENSYDYFMKIAAELSPMEKYGFLQYFQTYIKRQNDDVLTKGIEFYEQEARNNSVWWVRITAIQLMKNLDEIFAEREKVAKSKKDKLDANGSNEGMDEINKELTFSINQQAKIHNIFNKIKETETNEEILNYLNK